MTKTELFSRLTEVTAEWQRVSLQNRQNEIVLEGVSCWCIQSCWIATCGSPERRLTYTLHSGHSIIPHIVLQKSYLLLENISTKQSSHPFLQSGVDELSYHWNSRHLDCSLQLLVAVGGIRDGAKRRSDERAGSRVWASAAGICSNACSLGPSKKWAASCRQYSPWPGGRSSLLSEDHQVCLPSFFTG